MSFTLSDDRLKDGKISNRLLRQLGAWPANIALVAAMLVHTTAVAQEVDGEPLFRQRCGVCHSIDPGQKKNGPHLSGLIGRAAGSIEGARYSAPMRASGIIWDRTTLDTFLAAPRQLVSGTTMTVSTPDAAQRAAIITYLQGQKSTANN